MSPVAGAGTPSALVAGPGSSACSAVEKALWWMVVVRLPEWKPAAYTRLPSGVTASARGVSVKRLTMVSGSPPSEAPRLSASNTHTSARPTPGVVS